MDVFLYIWKESVSYQLFCRVRIGWQESRTRSLAKCPVVQESLGLRLLWSPYRIMLFLMRGFIRRGFPLLFKILFLK